MYITRSSSPKSVRYSLVQLDLVLSRCRRFFFSFSRSPPPPPPPPLSSLSVCIKSSCLIFCTRDLFLLPMCEAFFRSPLSLLFYIVDLLRTSRYFSLFIFMVLPLNTRHRVSSLNGRSSFLHSPWFSRSSCSVAVFGIQ